MTLAPADLPASLQPLVDRALARLAQVLPEPVPAELLPLLTRLAVASDFALDTLVRQPALLAQLAAPGCPPIPAPVLDPLQPSDWPAQLRRWRTAMSTRLIWRDLAGLDDVAQTLAGATTLAEDCLRLALDALQQEFAQRHGVVRDGAGVPQQLVVFGLGKLGGGELNFSSDIDLV